MTFQQASVQIQVGTLAGETFDIAVPCDERPVDLKQRLSTEFGVEAWRFVLVTGDGEVDDHCFLNDICTHDDGVDSLQLTSFFTEMTPQDVVSNTRKVLDCIGTEDIILKCRGSALMVANACKRYEKESRISRRSAYGCRSIAKRIGESRERHAMRMGKKVDPVPALGYWRKEWGGPTILVQFVEVPRKIPFARPQPRRGRCMQYRPLPDPCALTIKHQPLLLSEHVKRDIRVGRVALRGLGGQHCLLLLALRRLAGPALLELVDLLVRGGENVNVRDGNDMQPLHIACSLGRGKVALFLLKHGAQPDAVCRQGRTPLEYALKYFRIAVSTSRPDYWEDSALVRACCQMLFSRCETVRPSTSLEAIRMNLSVVATELALLKPYCSRLTKEEVREKSGIPEEFLTRFGEELWAGWPQAFLSLRPNAFADIKHEPHFANARWNLVRGILCTHYEADHPRGRVHKERRFDPSVEMSSTSEDNTSDWEGYESLTKSKGWEGYAQEAGKVQRGEDWWSKYKRKHATRRALRVPWMYDGDDCSVRASRSSRLARQMPRAPSKREKAWSQRVSENRRKKDRRQIFDFD